MAQYALKNKSSEATVRIGTIMGIPAVLRELGTDPSQVLAEAGLDVALFNDPNAIISYTARNRLLAQCAARTNCPHFGLLVGQKAGISSLGLVGLLTRYSPDVETALCNLVSAMHLHVRGATVGFTVDRQTAMLTYDIYLTNGVASIHAGDGAVAIMQNLMLALCGPDWKPTEVWFAHRRPDNVLPFRKFFQAPLKFDQEHNGIVFSRTWLKLRLPDTDPELQRLLRAQINTLEIQHREQFPEQVRSVLRAALLTSDASADAIAALFSMHSRTLSRRLNAFGTNFQALVDEVRYEIARQMLQDTALDISDIAASLNYADASAFTRAFHRWSGTTPARWRIQHGRLSIWGQAAKAG